MDIEIGSLGITGLNLDVLPEDLPPSILSDSLNLDYKARHVSPMLKELLKASPLPGNRLPLLLEPLYTAGNLLCWVAMTSDKAYLLYQRNWVDITPSTMQVSTVWQATHINGYLLLNNAKQKPLYIDIYDPLSPLKTYDIWPDGLICNVVTSLEGYLLGCSPTDNTSLFNKQMVIWSDVADPGSLPSNFEFTNPASRAGFTVLEDSEEALTALLLGNKIQLYRTNSIYDIGFIGGNSVFSFVRRQLQPNLLSRNSVAQYRNSHFGVGSGYFFIYNGFDVQPLGQDIVCTKFFQTLNKDYAYLISVMFDARLDQIIIAYPEGSSTLCNRALIYDINKQLWKKRELPNVSCISSGFFPSLEDTRSWDDLTETWATWEDLWGITYTQDEQSNYVMGTGTGFYKIPDFGDYMVASGTRLYIAFDSQDTTGNPVIARDIRKLVTEAWLEANGSLQFRFGASDKKASTISWGPWTSWVDNYDLYKSYIVAGKFLSIEFNNDVSEPTFPPPYFTLGGYKLLVKPAGRY